MTRQLYYSRSQGSGFVKVQSCDTYNLSAKALTSAVTTKSIAGIFTITLGGTEVNTIYSPVCHEDENGDVTHILGNPSDKKGEFGLSKIDINSYRSYLYVGDSTTIPASITPNQAIPVEHLVGTMYQDRTDIVGASISNYCVLPFRSDDLTSLDIHDDERMKLLKDAAIPTYEWLAQAKHIEDNQDDIELIVNKVLSDGDPDTNRLTYFESTGIVPHEMLKIALNGLHGTIASATSAEYVEEATEIKKFYICLLYTSPSPRDRTRSRMPSSA